MLDFCIIPKKIVADKRLSSSAKLLYGEIASLCNKEGYCWATNSYFAELFGVHIGSISRLLSSLENSGYIKTEIIRKEGSREINQRLIKLVDLSQAPTNKNVSGVFTKSLRPPKQNCENPINKNVKENNIIIKDEYIKIKNNKTCCSKYNSNTHACAREEKLQHHQHFSFTLEKKTKYSDLSDSYKQKLKEAIEALKDTLLTYDEFALSLEAKGNEYLDFLSAYKIWDNKQKQYAKLNSLKAQQHTQQTYQTTANGLSAKEERQKKEQLSENIRAKLTAKGYGVVDFDSWYNDSRLIPANLAGLFIYKNKGRFAFGYDPALRNQADRSGKTDLIAANHVEAEVA